MKLVVVASGDFFSDYGGGQVYVRNIVDELSRRQELNTTVVSFNRGQRPSIRKYKDISVYQINDETTLEDTLNELSPDIVHANGEKLLTSRVCKCLNIPCVVTAHHGGIVCPAGTLLNTNDEICCIPADYTHCLKCYLRHTPTGLMWYPLLKRCSQENCLKFGRLLKRLPFMPFVSPIGETGLIVTQKINEWQELYGNVTLFISPSDAMADALKRNGCPPSKIIVIPHGIPTIVSSTPQVTNYESQVTKFYYVGRINYVKGIHVMLDAFSSIEDTNIELHLIGGAGNKTELRYQNKLKRKYCEDKRIVWHGKLPYEQMNEVIKEYHCLIHPAIYLEVFGLNISEALAQKKYVIATRCGGAEMQIHSDKDGLVVEPDDREALAAAMKNYIKDPKQSQTTVRSISEHVDDLISTYTELANKHE